MDDWTPPPIAESLAASLGPERRARLAVLPRDDGRYELVIVAFDYFAELSILCGLLAAHGLDIASGDVHTVPSLPASPSAPSPPPLRGPRRRPAAEAPRRILDVFRVVPRKGAPDAESLERELLELLDLVAEGRGLEARERLNVRLAESLGTETTAPADAVAPVEIRFDNAADATWTAMEVRGPDTLGFLYALSNALAMRGIYVHQVRIESVNGQAADRFLIAHADGTKIEEAAEQEALRRAIVLIKQFTHFLPWAPDPARALRYFDQFLDRLMATGPESLGLFATADGLRDLARLLGSSAFLWEDVVRTGFERLLPVLAEWRTRPLRSRAEHQAELRRRCEASDDPRSAVNEYKDEQALIIDAKRLLDPTVTLETFSWAIGELAEAFLEQALDACRARLVEQHGRPMEAGGGECPLAVCALGKFGGGEMGYASDLELLFAYGGPGQTERSGIENGVFFESLVRELNGFIAAPEEGLFRIDLRLRPHGKKGPLASPLPSLRAYYRPGGEAAPFERQALIKLRWVAGDAALVRAVERVRDDFVWSDEPWDRETSLHLRERQVRELVPVGRFNVKLSRGGLVDVEYTAQYLQILHGRECPELRTPRTLEALHRLGAAGLLSPADHEALRDGYRFWRRVADGLRMLRGHAGDLLLPEEGSDEYGFLARRLGYPGGRREAASLLRRDVETHAARVASIFDRRFKQGDEKR
jgi:[glutamine synthetase] adenylyltransferase / [glutamine synthetase]-adenylyl-L-tyrosine phosphorylase